MPLTALREIFRANLGVKPAERVLVFTDLIKKGEVVSDAERERRERLRDIANMASAAARGMCRRIEHMEIPSTGQHGKEPPVKLWRMAFGEAAINALEGEGLMRPILQKRLSANQLERAMKIAARYKKSAVHAVVALTNFSTSHTTFRSLLTDVCGTRYASMPLFEYSMISGPMRVDYKAMARRTKAAAALLSKAVWVRITTPLGTDIGFSLKGRRGAADTGLLTKPGSFGNLPAGEAYIAPLEGTAEGTLVLAWAPTRELLSPVTVRVRGGMAVEVEGKDEFAAYLEAKLAERPMNANIAELGVGTNELATRPDNILESEKILGTIHIALGDNSSFGGRVKTPFHQDFVFFHPTVELEMPGGVMHRLLDEGRLAL